MGGTRLEGRHPKVMAGPGKAGSRLRGPGGGLADSGAQTNRMRVPRVIAYLAGEDARPVTGTVLAVDAGRVAAL